MMRPMRQRRHAGALTTVTMSALILLAVPVLSDTLRITCADGGGDLFEGHGHTVWSPGFCDADHACDGFCTFTFDPRCAVCLGNYSGRLTCSPDGNAEVCPGLPALPCPSGLPHVVLNNLGEKRHVQKRLHFTFAKRHFTLILRCEFGRGCPVPPQAPPPGVPDVGDVWSLQETTANTDCPASLLTGLRPPAAIRLSQNGVGITACIDPQDSGPDSMSPLGQGIVSDSTLSVSSGPIGWGIDTYTLSLVAPVPVSGTSTTVSEQWTFRQDNPARTPVCTRTATATMARRPMPPCTADEHCVAIGPCMRCNKHTLQCALSPLCQ
jgi:hypothetical protein